jgi:hypothetical protein
VAFNYSDSTITEIARSKIKDNKYTLSISGNILVYTITTPSNYDGFLPNVGSVLKINKETKYPLFVVDKISYAQKDYTKFYLTPIKDEDKNNCVLVLFDKNDAFRLGDKVGF